MQPDPFTWKHIIDMMQSVRLENDSDGDQSNSSFVSIQNNSDHENPVSSSSFEIIYSDAKVVGKVSNKPLTTIISAPNVHSLITPTPLASPLPSASPLQLGSGCVHLNQVRNHRISNCSSINLILENNPIADLLLEKKAINSYCDEDNGSADDDDVTEHSNDEDDENVLFSIDDNCAPETTSMDSSDRYLFTVYEDDETVTDDLDNSIDPPPNTEIDETVTNDHDINVAVLMDRLSKMEQKLEAKDYWSPLDFFNVLDTFIKLFEKGVWDLLDSWKTFSGESLDLNAVDLS